MFALGWLYDNGQGVTQDYMNGVPVASVTISVGQTDAMFSLASLFENGRGVANFEHRIDFAGFGCFLVPLESFEHCTCSATALARRALLNSLELRLQEAEANRLPYAQFLELLLQDEINVRDQRMLARRRKSADFREPRSLENFDFSFNPGINRAQIYELATSHFVRQHRDVLLVGPPGVGKSHLVQAIGLEALKAGFVVLYRSIFDLVRELLTQETLAGEARLLKKYLKPDLLVIDDMGLKILPAKSGEILLEIIMRRYENRSTMMTSNRPIEEWGKLLSDVPAAGAILDRLLHHAEIIPINGRSYRLQPTAKQPPSRK